MKDPLERIAEAQEVIAACTICTARNERAISHGVMRDLLKRVGVEYLGSNYPD